MIIIDAKIRTKVWYKHDGAVERFECWWEGGEIAGISDDMRLFDFKPTVGGLAHCGNLDLVIVAYENGISYVRRATEADKA